MHCEYISKIKLKMQNTFSLKVLAIALVSSFLSLILLGASLVIYPLKIDIEYSQKIFSSDSTLIAAYLTSDHKWRLRTKPDEVSAELKKAIIQKEDKYFYYHFGFNPIAIAKAGINNIFHSSDRLGASTISMQVIRLLEKRKRTYFSKAVELLRTLQLELLYSKDEILEMYLSLLPYGSNIEGAESAAYIYFKTPANKLSLSQSVMLAVIPNNPNKLRPDKSKIILSYRNKYLNKFLSDGIFTKESIDDALSEPLTAERNEVPNMNPHFTLELKKHNKAEEIYTYLDLKLQSEISNIIAPKGAELKSDGINNLAIIVIDNSNNSVISYFGSQDFYDSLALGQNNGITALRSPGSTLKPSLYALAMDKGILSPKMILFDIPTDFSGYFPENFDELFHGAVTAESALFNSLNIPAVKILSEVKMESFIGILKRAGFTSISKSAEKLGLSMILGGCSATLESLTNLYSSLANSGKYRELKYTKTQDNDKSEELFSDAASYLITKILMPENQRKETEYFKIKNINIPNIAWKTGTSFGMRDAWAIGYNNKYTVGVWTGNFTGDGSPKLIGSKAALPILFDIYNYLSYKKQFVLNQPTNITPVYVCKTSGKIPNEFCKDLILDDHIKGITNIGKCDIHKEIFCSSDTSISYCYDCLPKSGYLPITFEVYPNEYYLWLDNNKLSYPKIPQHNPNCTSVNSSSILKILSPSRYYTYFIETGSETEIALQASSAAGSKFVYWYIDNDYYGKSKNGEKIFFKPFKENHKIKCIDSRGAESEYYIKCKFY